MTERISSEFLDYAGRKPVRIIYPKPSTCPHCGDVLWLQSIKPAWFPYIHVDTTMKCPMCDREYIFGIPMSRDAGLAMHIWDTNPVGAMNRFDELDTPTCKYIQHGPMLKTKIFGDWFTDFDEKIRFQWKCTTCYMVFQVTADRNFPHGDDDPLSPEEKDMILKRLTDMGYIE